MSHNVTYNFSYCSKRLEFRFYHNDSYEAWKKAHSELLPKQNEFDFGPPSSKYLENKQNFLNLVEKYKNRIPTEEMFYFAVYEKDTGNQIGIMFLSDIIRKIFQNCFLGYQVFNNFWRKGYGEEITRSAIDIAFNHLKLHRIECAVELNNFPSIALLDKVGFHCEGISKKRLNFDKWTDTLTYVKINEGP